MELFKDLLIRALDQLVHPKGIVWRTDAPVRALEGLKEEPSAVVLGDVPPRVEITLENGSFFVDVLGDKNRLLF